MTGIGSVRREVERAETAAELLDAAYQAFEALITAIRSCEDSGTAAVAPLAFAAAAAAEGRDAIAAAPSLLPAGSVSGVPVATGDEVAAVVTALSGLAGLLAGRLRRAAGTAATAGDRAACAAAARQAERVRVLLSGGEP
jgi:hypothetical protein